MNLNKFNATKAISEIRLPHARAIREGDPLARKLLSPKGYLPFIIAIWLMIILAFVFTKTPLTKLLQFVCDKGNFSIILLDHIVAFSVFVEAAYEDENYKCSKALPILIVLLFITWLLWI